MGELQKKEEEMRQMFVQRVKEKEAELKEAEKEVQSLNSDPAPYRNMMCNACLRKLLLSSKMTQSIVSYVTTT